MYRELIKKDIHKEGFLEVLSETVRLFSDRPAVIYRNKIYSYDYIWKSALGFSHSLKTETSPFIGLCFRESAEYIQCLLSVWMAGKSFLMLDRNISNDRIMKYMQISGSDRILSDNSERFRDCSFRADRPEFYRISGMETVPVFDPERSAYAVCSSGSSGEPKVIHILHRGILNFLTEQTEFFQLNEKSRILVNTPLGFDASISEIAVSLISGSALCISEADLKNPEKLMKEADRMSVTHLYIPPSLLPFITADMIPDSLETVFFGGEESSPEKVRELSDRLRMINIYGPAETTVCASMKVCGADWQDQDIGKPIRNTEWILLDDSGIESGTAGEICISGIGLAAGYIGQPELNESKFIFYNDKVFYRTGDKAEKKSDGSFLFKGRNDRQWKRNGKLIEPAELEKTALSFFPGTRAAAVPDRSRRPVLFLEKPDSETDSLRTKIIEALPSWFIPSKIICLKEFPKNTNGKTDFSKLAETAEVSETAYEEMQDVISLAWKIGTGHFPVFPSENFFASGGDSVSLLRMGLFLSDYGFDLSVSQFYEHPCFEDLKNLLQNGSEQFWTAEELEKTAEEYSRTEIQNNYNVFKNEIRTVILTGASGGLGSEISRILCTVFQTRTFGLYFRNRPDFSHPLFIPVRSDLRKDLLGLNEADWKELSESADCIIHSGADVHLLKPLSALKDTNLGGLRNVLTLLNSGRQKKLEYISSLGFFLNSDLKEKEINENLDFSGISGIRGGYSASKFTAELILKKLIESGNENIRIFRPGLLFRQKKRNSENDFFSRILNEAVKMSSFPSSSDYESDLTPLEICAESICELIFMNTEEKVFHIANPAPFTLADMASFVRSVNENIMICRPEQWTSESEEDIFMKAGLSRFSESGFYGKNSVLDIFRRTGFLFSLKNILKYSQNDSVRNFLAGKKKLTFTEKITEYR